jgi:hypothetical protein
MLRFEEESNTEHITKHIEKLWHNGTEAIKALFAPGLNKQQMKEATKCFTNIIAGHHDLHVSREPYNPDCFIITNCIH